MTPQLEILLREECRQAGEDFHCGGATACYAPTERGECGETVCRAISEKEAVSG